MEKKYYLMEASATGDSFQEQPLSAKEICKLFQETQLEESFYFVEAASLEEAWEIYELPNDDETVNDPTIPAIFTAKCPYCSKAHTPPGYNGETTNQILKRR